MKTSQATWWLAAATAIVLLAVGLALLAAWLKPLLPPEDPEFPFGSAICALLGISVGALVGGVTVGYLGAGRGERLGDASGPSSRGIMGLFGGGLAGAMAGMIAGGLVGLIAGLCFVRLLFG